MDKLEEIFELQKKFDGYVAESRGVVWDLPLEEKMQKKSIALFCELAELVEELNYKWWKKAKPVDGKKVKEEMIDILHFFVSMCLTMDMTAEEVYQIYKSKNEENFKRQQGTSDKKGYEKE